MSGKFTLYFGPNICLGGYPLVQFWDDKIFSDNKKKPHRNAAIVKNHWGSVTPKENELNYLKLLLVKSIKMETSRH